VYKTQVKKKNLNPQFEETFTFHIADTTSQECRLEVLDWDRVGKDDPLGNLTLLLSELAKSPDRQADGTSTLRKSYPLLSAKHGEIEVTVKLTPSEQDSVAASGLVGGNNNPRLRAGRLTVTVHRGIGLKAADTSGSVGSPKALATYMCDLCILRTKISRNFCLFVVNIEQLLLRVVACGRREAHEDAEAAGT
jgi:Ca2+-dependent lipid-binding protein